MDQQFSAEREECKVKYVKAAVCGYKGWLDLLIYMGCDMPLYAFSLFLPTIISKFEYPLFKLTSSLLEFLRTCFNHYSKFFDRTLNGK
jgi:hypothetical protein